MKLSNLNLSNRLDIFLRIKFIEYYLQGNLNNIKDIYLKYIKIAT